LHAKYFLIGYLQFEKKNANSKLNKRKK